LATRSQQGVADRIRHCVSECWQFAPGFILNRPQRSRYRSRARADAQHNHRGHVQRVASDEEGGHVRCHSDEEAHQEKARSRDPQTRDEARSGVQANDADEYGEADGVADLERGFGDATEGRAL
jgi:hypothetical protein